MPPQRRSKEELDQLVAAAHAGSSDGLDGLIEALSECLWAEFANRRKLRLLSPSCGPSDLIQDALVHVRLNFHNFRDVSFGALRRWTRGILFNRSREIRRNSRCRNELERRESICYAIRQRIGFNLDGCRPDDALAREEDAACAYQLFQGLRVDERTIIDLRLFQSLTYKDISQLTRLKPEAARKAFDRALQRLTELFLSDGKP